ncbi:predicted protein [Lichtheimia corymbifera JMRC:FSU:9682]|uniref:Uncharacterized protein n=1 Tax=Lichtheimia corymbifera JMRC:FSU:9682 TaxID=1263082 RepID=A0A068RIS1_9FUNG|nr:predicted protein [Lichtheimia corymbifera JMRC:FSU:9682]
MRHGPCNRIRCMRREKPFAIGFYRLRTRRIVATEVSCMDCDVRDGGRDITIHELNNADVKDVDWDTVAHEINDYTRKRRMDNTAIRKATTNPAVIDDPFITTDTDDKARLDLVMVRSLIKDAKATSTDIYLKESIVDLDILMSPTKNHLSSRSDLCSLLH